MTTQHRVAVTGVGVVSPIGIGKDRFWESLTAGRSGVGRIPRFDVTGWDTQIAAEVRDFDPSLWMARKDVRRNDRFVQFAYAASRLALEDAGFTITRQHGPRVGPRGRSMPTATGSSWGRAPASCCWRISSTPSAGRPTSTASWSATG